jgi:hypothetical protein
MNCWNMKKQQKKSLKNGIRQPKKATDACFGSPAPPLLPDFYKSMGQI